MRADYYTGSSLCATGRRSACCADAYAKVHPIISEVEKTGDERGRYRHPIELGQPKSLGIDEYRRSKMHLPEPPKPPKQAAQLAPPKVEPPRPQPPQLHQPSAPQSQQVKPPATQESVAVPDPAK